MSAPARAASSWLALREDADSRARSTDLVHRLTALLTPRDRLVVHDLGCGTGSMGRWLAPRLATPLPTSRPVHQPAVRQCWVLHDRDADLLAEAERRPGTGPGAVSVEVRTRWGDITAPAGDPAGADLISADLITASALLDMLTADELDRLSDVCTAPGCPVLITLSVTGRVELDPADPLDDPIREAFNADQRRDAGGGPLLGPDAGAAAAEALRRRGADVTVRPSPWRLAANDTALIRQWLDGWVGAACEQDPGLISTAVPYLLRRRASATAGRLQVTVHHDDLLAVPR